jgi:hypothetical protein
VAQTGTGTRTNDPKAIVRETTVGVTAMHDTVARLHGDDWRVALARHTERSTPPKHRLACTTPARLSGPARAFFRSLPRSGRASARTLLGPADLP